MIASLVEGGFKADERVALGTRRAPEPPRSLIAQAGSMKSVLTWAAPANDRGVGGYRVFVDDDKQVFATISDPSTRKIEIPMTAGASRFAAVSSFTKVGKNVFIESPRIPIVLTANTDKFVVTGTAGQSSGTSPSAPPEYPSEPSGGIPQDRGSGVGRQIL